MNSHDKALPLVTAAVICYNHARFVVEALESVKSQAYPNLHLVVIDDCSKDDSVEVIQRWLNRHWPDSEFVAHKTNMGVCRTVNDALAHAKGKYLRFLAADDRWVPNTLTPQVEFMECLSEDVGVVYSDAYQIDESGELLPKMFIEAHRPLANKPSGWIFDTLIDGNFIPAMTAVIRLCCFETVGRYDESLVFEDWDMWLRLSRQFKFEYFPVPIAEYRVVGTSMVRTLSPEIRASEDRILVKCLRRGWVTGRKKKTISHSAYMEAYRAYRQRLPGRVSEAVLAFRCRVCPKHALLLLCVVIRLPHRRFEKLVHLLSDLKHNAKPPRISDEPYREH